MYVLEVMSGPLDGKTWAFEREITIGRDDAVATACITIDRFISRKHARLYEEDGSACGWPISRAATGPASAGAPSAIRRRSASGNPSSSGARPFASSRICELAGAALRRSPHPARRDRRDRGVQGRGARQPPGPGRGGARRRDDRGCRALRRCRDVRGARAAAGAHLAVGRVERIPHIALARDADVVAIVPATANTIAKIALGLADDLLDQRRARDARAAGHRAGDEHRDARARSDARAPRHAARARRDDRRARASASSPSASTAPAALPTRRRCSRRSRARSRAAATSPASTC